MTIEKKTTCRQRLCCWQLWRGSTSERRRYEPPSPRAALSFFTTANATTTHYVKASLWSQSVPPFSPVFQHFLSSNIDFVPFLTCGTLVCYTCPYVFIVILLRSVDSTDAKQEKEKHWESYVTNEKENKSGWGQGVGGLSKTKTLRLPV